MRTTFPFLAVVVIAGVLAGGCTVVEKKAARGMSNMLEFTRLGEVRRSVEQTTLFDQPGGHYYAGYAKGMQRSFVRTILGVYETAFPFLPPYDPLLTDYLSVNPVYPDNYAPGILADSLFATDTNLGFSGGDVAPFIPGSRFRIFDTH